MTTNTDINITNVEFNKPIVIRFKDRGRNQYFKCTIGCTDGSNSIIYDEEGNPNLCGNKSFEVLHYA